MYPIEFALEVGVEGFVLRELVIGGGERLHLSLVRTDLSLKATFLVTQLVLGLSHLVKRTLNLLMRVLKEDVTFNPCVNHSIIEMFVKSRSDEHSPGYRVPIAYTSLPSALPLSLLCPEGVYSPSPRRRGHCLIPSLRCEPLRSFPRGAASRWSCCRPPHSPDRYEHTLHKESDHQWAVPA